MTTSATTPTSSATISTPTRPDGLISAGQLQALMASGAPPLVVERVA